FFRVHRNKSLLRRARYTRRGDFSEARQRHFGPGPTSLRAGIRVRRRAGPRPETRAGAALARLAGPAVLGELDHRLALPALDVELAVPDAFDERLPLLGGVDEDVAFGVLGHPQGHQAVVGVADLQGRGRAVGARRAFPAGRRHVELALERMLTLRHRPSIKGPGRAARAPYPRRPPRPRMSPRVACGVRARSRALAGRRVSPGAGSASPSAGRSSP